MVNVLDIYDGYEPKQKIKISNLPLFLPITFKRPELAADLLTGVMSCRLRLVSNVYVEYWNAICYI